MSNQIERQYTTLHDLLEANGLVKIAGDQTITHKTVEGSQKCIGKCDQEIIKDEINGQVASEPGAEIKHTERVETPPNCQNLNTDPNKAMASTGTGVNVMAQNGDSASLPKSAADYRKELARILHKQAAQEKEQEQPVILASDVMAKLAALDEHSTQEAIDECGELMQKLAATNPLFLQVRDNILMRKMAEDIDALAEAEGIDPEQATAALDQAAEADPSMMSALEDEANGEAVAELAEAEQGAGELMAGAQELADNASANLGVEVTAEDMLNAIDQVEAAAEEMGVSPEALIEAAVEEMQAEGEDDVSPEEEAQAQELIDMAAEQYGLSPEEVLQMAADMDESGETPAEEAPAEEASVEKAASYKARTPRAAYVQHLIHK